MPETASSGDHHRLSERLRDFIRSPEFSCVGAKSALARDQITICVARDIRSAWNDLDIYGRLLEFVRSYRPEKKLFQSFAVVFQQPADLSEAAFERCMWDRLQSLSDKDVWHGQQHDSSVSPDPDNPHFSLSFGGEACFVVGLHPGASRKARQFETPCLVFNLHDQFEQLRAEGRYERLRDTILDRDVALSGSLNPMLARFGEISEARQYSGRAVGEDWVCPYHTPKVKPRRAP